MPEAAAAPAGGTPQRQISSGRKVSPQSTAVRSLGVPRRKSSRPPCFSRAPVKNESEAQELQSKMQKESVDKVTKRGWTPEHYVTVAQAINADPQLAEKTLALIGKPR